MPQIRNFAEAHRILAKYVDRKKQPGSYSLDRMQDIMSQLGNPQDNYKVIHVAGTSGKTSTCYYIAALLNAAGQKVGMTVSPHVDEVNERVQINLEPMPEKQFCKQLGEFIEIIKKTKIEPTYFELLVAFAFWQFDKQSVDYAVVEVGLGGLLDGTNIANRPDKTCIITDIGLDHTSVLGNTLEEIATQKAGIIQDHNQVFIYEQSPEVMTQVRKRCKTKHAVLHVIQPESVEADFKDRNYLLAKNVYDFLDQNEEFPNLNRAKLNEIKNLNIPARMEVIGYRGKTIIIDGSHNQQKMAALVKAYKNRFFDQKVAVLISFVDAEADRAGGALEELSHVTSKILITSFIDSQDTPKKSVEINQLSDLAQKAGFKDIRMIKNPKLAMAELLQSPENILLVTGSFYLLNQIRPLILNSND